MPDDPPTETVPMTKFGNPHRVIRALILFGGRRGEL